MTLGSNHSTVKRLPTILHFGFGKLGVGAVLPFLVYNFGSNHRIIAYDTQHGKRATIKGGTYTIGTSTGDRIPFYLPADTNENAGANVFGDSLIETLKEDQERRILLFGNRLSFDATRLIDMVHEFSDPLPTISCSLGSNQQVLIDRLTYDSHKWERALVFEEKVTCWTNGAAQLKNPWHHIMVDKFCSELTPLQDGSGWICQCEPWRFSKFLVPFESTIPGKKRYDSPQTLPNGVSLKTDWLQLQYLRADYHHHYDSKRALVDAPRAITGLLCCRYVIERKMNPDHQYVAPLQQMLLTQRVHWPSALDHYIRMRAIEIAWKRRLTLDPGGDLDIEALHACFWKSYRIAKQAQNRLFNSSDLLYKVTQDVAGEFKNFEYDEHIRDPVTYFEDNSRSICNHWTFGRPNVADIQGLRTFLTDSFSLVAQTLGWGKHMKSTDLR